MTDTKRTLPAGEARWSPKEPSCLNEIPKVQEMDNSFIKHIAQHKEIKLYKPYGEVICKICHKKAEECCHPYPMVLVSDVQEMVIRRIEKRNKRLANVLKYKKSNKEFDELCKIMNEDDMGDFNITDAMIEEYKQKEARER